MSNLIQQISAALSSRTPSLLTFIPEIVQIVQLKNCLASPKLRKTVKLNTLSHNFSLKAVVFVVFCALTPLLLSHTAKFEPRKCYLRLSTAAF